MAANLRCLRCGKPLNAPGQLCPTCLSQDQAVISSSQSFETESPEDETVGGLRGTARPERIGPYRILEEVGEGGMGIVYLAEQEIPLRRRVAIKVIKRGMDTREVVARFEAERQALAIMDHSAIARICDCRNACTASAAASNTDSALTSAT